MHWQLIPSLGWKWTTVILLLSLFIESSMGSSVLLLLLLINRQWINEQKSKETYTVKRKDYLCQQRDESNKQIQLLMNTKNWLLLSLHFAFLSPIIEIKRELNLNYPSTNKTWWMKLIIHLLWFGTNVVNFHTKEE